MAVVLGWTTSVWAQSLTINGAVTTNTCPGGTVRDGGRACQYGGTHTFDAITLINGAVVYVAPFNGSDKNATGNLVFKSKSTIRIDATSRITAKGAGYQKKLCDNGSGPTATAGGRGGCAVKDSGGGGAHRGRGGQGTKDCFVYGNSQTCQFPQEWEENCGYLAPSGTSCVYADGLNGAHNCSNPNYTCANCDGDPSVAGEPYYHHILQPEFGASGGDKGCADGWDGSVRSGSGGGRIVLFAANDNQSGELILEGRVVAHGERGCASGNDSAGGGAGGTILLVGDHVDIRATARILAHGGRGGDSQPKCLPCTTNANCESGQTCVQGRCSPCNCTPCQPPSNTCPAGYPCKNLGGALGNVCVNAAGTCDPYDPGENEAECAGTQNSGTCDDCAGGGGGGIINVQSRVASIDPKAFFDVRGGQGGICPICAGEAGAGSGELQLDGAYLGEVCDGFDNDFNGLIDDGLGELKCAGGKTIPACINGIPQQCPADHPACVLPVTDTRPRFVVVLDTSGSMLTDIRGVPTFGDGSPNHSGVDTASDPDLIDGNNSRLFTAKRALTQVLSAFPHADYALARYHQDVGLNRSCQTASWFECQNNCCSYDDPRNNVPPAFEWIPACVLPTIYPGAGYPSALSSNINIGWTSQNDCINYAGSCGIPRRGADILVGFDAPLEQHLMWLDGRETAFNPSTVPADHCAFGAGGDCEIRATGPTPLAGSLHAVHDYLTPIVACDGAIPCRKYSVILLTDGAESCQGNPVAAAQNLRTLDPRTSVDTFVVGFSVLPEEESQLNAIAHAGGTNKAFLVGSESALANALASIIAASSVYELCNDLDDDCDGLIDEDFPEKGMACHDSGLGVCQGTGIRVCNATTDGTVCMITNPGASPTPEICNGLDDDCDGLIDEDGVCDTCIPMSEVCNGKDDNCNSIVDDDPIDVGVACGYSLGECVPGKTKCVNGVLICDGEVGPHPEVCDGLDNDCDGVVDGMTRLCYTGAAGTQGVGICRAGSEACIAVQGSGVEAWGACIGQITPASEICDGLDNDCNGLVDDRVPDGLGHFTGDPCCAHGSKCGTGECTEGVYVCAGSQVVCDGGKGPSMELCDHLDNDCNGAIDDVPGIGTACILPSGCAGELACDYATGGLACVSPTIPVLEICNGIDDDCDGQVDEEPEVAQNDSRVGVACKVPEPPHDKPPCKAGITVCRNGVIVCEGAIEPEPEICDGIDNDCDGIPDQPDPCPGDTVCDQGICVAPCGSGEFPCPGGFSCVDGYCVPNSSLDAGTGGSGGTAGAGGSGGSSVDAGDDGALADGAIHDSSMGGSGGTTGMGGMAGNNPDASAAGTGGKGSGPPPENYGLTTGGGGIACGIAVPKTNRRWLMLGALGLVALAVRRSRREAFGQGGWR
ncbi:MAG TPA: MopE-related protein [Polyangiaceae bacterium]|nr:MopE-related protein [Polyangiaceae bacterium]